ncbi:MAG: AAA family ATPase [Blautia hansenii]
MKENTIITVSREYGSGGKEISEILAKKLGVRCYDRQILYLAAQEIGAESVSIESINRLSYGRNNIGDGILTSVMGIGNIPIYNQMFLEQAKIIQKLATMGSAVFLGRCADYVLRENQNHYSFFIYANKEFKKNRAKKYYKNASKSATTSSTGGLILALKRALLLLAPKGGVASTFTGPL